jgi:hypothetical protein
MKIKFDYTPYPSADYTGRDTLAWRPMVDVTLFGPKDFRNVKALIDTGADDCLIHRDRRMPSVKNLISLWTPVRSVV